MCIKVKLDSDSGHAPTAKARWAGMSWKMCGSLAALAAHVKPVRKMNRLTIDKRESLTSSRPPLHHRVGKAWEKRK